MAYSLLVNTYQTLTTTGATAGINTTGVTLLIVAAHWRTDGPGEPSLTDSKTNTWTPLTMRGSSASGVRLYYCQGGSVGLGHTFTLTGGTFQGAIHVAGYSGPSAGPFDQENGAVTSVDASQLNTGSVTPANANSLVIAALSARWWADAPFIGSPMTMIHSQLGEAGVDTTSALAHVIQTTAAAVNPLWGWFNDADAATAIAVFSLGSSGMSGTVDGLFGAMSATASGYMDVVGTGVGQFGALAASGTDTITPSGDGVGIFGALSAVGVGTASSPGYAIIAHTQGAMVTKGTTPAIDTSGADLLVVNTTQYADSSKAALTDFYSNTWTPLNVVSGPGAYERLYYVRGGTVGPGHTFTWGPTDGSSFYGAIQVAAFRGSPPSPLQSQNGFEAQSVTSIKPGAVVPSQGGALIVCGIQNADGISTLAIDSGFTIADRTLPQSGITSGGALAYLFQSAAVPVNPQWTWPETGWDQATAIAVFAGTISENFVNASVSFGALLADASGGMAAVGDGVGAFGALAADVTGGQVGDGSVVGVFGPLAAEGIGASAPPIAIISGSFGPMTAAGAGFMQATAHVFTTNTTTKGFVVNINPTGVRTLVLQEVPGEGPAPASYPLTATIHYSGLDFAYHENAGTVLDNYVDPAGRFTQRCVVCRIPALPEMTVFFRPDVTGTRAEVIFELGDVFADLSMVNAHMTAYTVYIAR